MGVTAISRCRGDGEVGGKAKFADDGVEEAPPFGVVGLLDIKFDWDVVADIDRLNDGGRGWGKNDVFGEGGAAINRGRGGDVILNITLEQGVEIHGGDGWGKEKDLDC